MARAGINERNAVDLDAIDPHRLAFALGNAVERDALGSVMAYRRVARTVQARIVARYGEASEPAAWMRDASVRDVVVLAAGAAFHAADLQRIIDGAALRALNAALGDTVVAHGMASRPLDAGGGSPTPDTIRADGEACLVAWRDAHLAEGDPGAIALTLLMPPGWFARRLPDAAHREHGPALIADAVAVVSNDLPDGAARDPGGAR